LEVAALHRIQKNKKDPPTCDELSHVEANLNYSLVICHYSFLKDNKLKIDPPVAEWSSLRSIVL